MKKNKFIDNVGDLYNTLCDRSKSLVDFHIMNSQMMELELKHSEDFTNTNTNLLVAAFCTTWARLKLWSVMIKLQDRVIYHDTDSVIFSVKETDKYIPPLGKFLGNLTNELTCKETGCKGCEIGHWIEEFVSCGPKNYSFKLNTGEVSCKVRGFSLNYKNSQIINFESMKEALFAWEEKNNEMIKIKTKILRGKHKNPIVYSKEIKKRYSVVCDKRKVLDNFVTIPYGFKINKY